MKEIDRKLYTELEPTAPGIDFISRIGKDWALLTASDKDRFNPMTVSWGGAGVLWGLPVCFVFIRPQRYTYGIAESGRDITLSFFDENYRDALRYCGSHSGRDGDKPAACGITPATVGAAFTFEEAELVIRAEKLYAQDLREDCFIDRALLDNYKKKDYHRMYVCRIAEVLKKN